MNYDKTIYRSSNYRDFILINGGVFFDKWTKSQIPDKPISYYLYYTGTFMIGTENGLGRLKKEIAIGVAADIGEPIRLNNIRSNLSNDRYQLGLAGALALRYYFKKPQMFVRVCYSPFYSFPEKRFYPLWGGVAVGINFGKQTN